MHSFSWSFPSSTNDSTTSAKKERMKGKPKTSKKIQIDRRSIFFGNKSLKRGIYKNHSDEMNLCRHMCMRDLDTSRERAEESQSSIANT